MKIIIIGAGLGGLTAAFLCASNSHNVIILERAQELGSRGGGISMRPSASRILQRWGLETDLEVICDRSNSVTYRDLYTGKAVNRIIEPPENADFGTTRRAMIKLLYSRAVQAGAQVRFNANVVRVFDDEKHAVVTLENGEEISGDLILAADGIKSHTRKAILSDLGPHEQWDPVMDDTTFYAIDQPVTDRSDLPILTENNDITTWYGKGAYVVSRCSSKFNRMGVIYALHGKTDQKSLWDEMGDIEYVRKHFSNTCDDLSKALQHISSCTRWKLAQAPDLPRWSSQQGRIVLLGDSAHAMHPNAAQGYSTIIEEVDVLVYLLESFLPSKEFNVPQIIKIWQDICKPRAERVKALSNYNTMRLTGRTSVPDDSATGKKAEGVIENDVIPDKDAHFTSEAFWKWNSDYDGRKEAEKYLAKLGQMDAKL